MDTYKTQNLIYVYMWLHISSRLQYLLLNSMSLGHHGIKVMTFGNAVNHQLLDLHLQVCVGSL